MEKISMCILEKCTQREMSWLKCSLWVYRGDHSILIWIIIMEREINNMFWGVFNVGVIRDGM